MSFGFSNMEILSDLDESSYKAEAEARLHLGGRELVATFRDLVIQWSREMEMSV